MDLEQPAEPLLALDLALVAGVITLWERNHVFEALMVAFLVVVLDVLSQGSPQTVLAEDHESVEDLRFD